MTRPALLKKIRRAIGNGTTVSERGMTTLFFRRGHDAWMKAKANLDAQFGQPKLVTWGWLYQNGAQIHFETPGANNFVDLPY